MTYDPDVLAGNAADHSTSPRNTPEPACIFTTLADNAHSYDASGTLPVACVDRLREHGAIADAGAWADGIARSGNATPALAKLRAFLSSLGKANLSLARLYEGHYNALFLVCRYGSAQQKANALRDARLGHMFGVWNADRPGGLTLTRVEDRWRVRGGKRFCSGAGLLSRPLVTAQDGDRRLLVLLDASQYRPVSGTWQAAGMIASSSLEVDIDTVVDDSAIIGDADDYYRQPEFSAGAWRFLACQLGAIDALVDYLRLHLQSTGRGTDALQQARLGRALAARETASLWVKQASERAEDRTGDAAGRIAYVNLARLAVEQTALEVMQIVQSSVGLAAFMTSNPIERTIRDLQVYLRQPAPDEALLSAARHHLNT
jgi:alkylation response protein AidB-like acyl-CoA dehydrogenase